MNKNKKLSLLLVGCLIASSTNTFFWRKPKPWYTKLFNGASKTWSDYRKTTIGAFFVVIALLMKRKLEDDVAKGGYSILEWCGEKTKILPLFRYLGTKIGIKTETTKRLDGQGIGIKKLEKGFEAYAPRSLDKSVKILATRTRANAEAKHKGEEPPFEMPKFMLLYGESQTGKSTSEELLAYEVGADYCISINCGDLEDKFVGESNKIARDLFKLAESYSNEDAPCVIILEEIDAIFSKHERKSTTGVAKRIMYKFQTEIDKAIKGKINVRVYANTNHLSDIHKPSLNRFKKGGGGIYKVDLPNQYARKTALLYNLKKHDIELINDKGEDVSELWAIKKALERKSRDFTDIENLVIRLKNSQKAKEIEDRKFNPTLNENIRAKFPRKKTGLLQKAKRLLFGKPQSKPTATTVVLSAEQIATQQEAEQFEKAAKDSKEVYELDEEAWKNDYQGETIDPEVEAQKQALYDHAVRAHSQQEEKESASGYDKLQENQRLEYLRKHFRVSSKKQGEKRKRKKKKTSTIPTEFDSPDLFKDTILSRNKRKCIDDSDILLKKRKRKIRNDLNDILRPGLERSKRKNETKPEIIDHILRHSIRNPKAEPAPALPIVVGLREEEEKGELEE